MTFDKRTVAFIAITFFGISAYQLYLQKKYPDYYAGQHAQAIQDEMEADQAETAASSSPGQNKSSKAENQDLSGSSAASSGQAIEEAPIQQLSPEKLRIETDNRIFTFDQNTSTLLGVKLKDYYVDKARTTMVDVLDSPMVVQGSTDPSRKVLASGYTGERQGNSLKFSKKAGGFLIDQVFTVPQHGYGIDIFINFTNISNDSRELNAGMLALQDVYIPEDSGGFGPSSMMAMQKSFIHSIDGSRDEEVAQGHCEEPEGLIFNLENENVDFIGFDNHYFLAVLHPTSQKMNFKMSVTKSMIGGVCPVALVASQAQGFVEPGQKVSLKFSGYFGPKDLEILEAHGPEFVNTVKFGWFSIFAKPLLQVVKFIYDYVGNYGLAIMLVTLILKMIFFPLTKAAAVSMKKMQKLQPEMNRLREKYSNDPQRQQKELMAFMSKHKVNPAKGCLPILPQIPVFIAFYNVLSQAIELRHAPFFGWITDLSKADPYYVTPLLMGVGMFLQQKLTPNPGMDKNQAKIMLMMPVIFTVMMLSLPAGMVLYMITNTIVSILQQQWLNRKLDKQFG